jgi:hypothetical protein
LVVKNEKKVDETNINLNQSISDKNLNDSKDVSMAFSDEDAIRMYQDLLEGLKKRVDNLILNQTHDQFKDIMREKGYEPQVNKPKLKRNRSDEKLFRDLNAKDEIIYDYNKEEDEINILKAREEIVRDYNRAKEKEKFKTHEPREVKK